MRLFSIFLLWISFAQLTGCDSSSDQPIESAAHYKYMGLIGVVLELPHTGIVLQNGQLESVETESEHTDFTIVTRIDGTCIQCIVDFEKWKPLVELVTDRDDVSIRFYVHIRDIDEFVSMFYPRLGVSTPIQVDTLDLFLEVNGISSNDNRNFHTFLLDKDGKVILVGDPASHDSILKYYLKAIGH